jgi:integration host factor subunit alpha
MVKPITLTRRQLAEVLFRRLGLNKREANEMVARFFAELGRALATGQLVKLAEFGQFIVRTKSARPGRNPKTGQAFPIATRRVVSFRPSLVLRRRVAQQK